MAGDEICVVGIAGPGADVDDVEGLVDEVADGGELVEYERGSGGKSGQVQRVGGGGAEGWKCGEADVDVLGVGVSKSVVVEHGENKP